jgi:hypothetical protein
MRYLRIATVLSLGILCLSLLATARPNKYGVADSREMNLTAPTLVGGVLLPAGDYKVIHIMEGENHIMVFKEMHAKNPAEARVKCQLVPLAQKATRTEQVIVVNAANQRVLHSLVFEGDSAQHVF